MGAGKRDEGQWHISGLLLKDPPRSSVREDPRPWLTPRGAEGLPCPAHSTTNSKMMTVIWMVLRPGWHVLECNSLWDVLLSPRSMVRGVAVPLTCTEASASWCSSASPRGGST